MIQIIITIKKKLFKYRFFSMMITDETIKQNPELNTD